MLDSKEGIKEEARGFKAAVVVAAPAASSAALSEEGACRQGE